MRDDATPVAAHQRQRAPRAPAEGVVEEWVTIPTPDGRNLRGRLRSPIGPIRAAAVIHGATGAPQGYYAAFAEWLAVEKGVASLTYDYRGFGASQDRPLRREPATMRDWGLIDQPAALAALAGACPDAPLWVVGHSLGGLFIDRHPGMDRVERAILVASSTIHWTRHHWSYAPLAFAFWNLVGPPAVAFAGRLPGRAIGFGVDLPAGVYWDWRRWCQTHGFADPELGPAPVTPNGRYQTLFVAVADDVVIPPEQVWAMMPRHRGRPLRQLTVDPAAYGRTRIGHLGLFKRGGAPIWRAMLARADRP